MTSLALAADWTNRQPSKAHQRAQWCCRVSSPRRAPSSAMRADTAAGDLTFICARGPKANDILGSKIVLPLDVTVDAQIDAVFAELAKVWGHFDILVHAVAYAPADALDFVGLGVHGPRKTIDKVINGLKFLS